MTLPRLQTLDSERPVVIHENTHADSPWRIVHGVYGHALLCGRTDAPVDVTATWNSAMAHTVRLTLVTPGTPTPIELYLPRDLLSDGGSRGSCRIDLIGLLACITFNGTQRQLWLTLNRTWLEAFMAAAHLSDIDPP